MNSGAQPNLPPPSVSPRPLPTAYQAAAPAAVPYHAPTSHQVRLPAGVNVANPWARLGSYFLESLLVLVTLGIGWIIWAATLAGNGQTPAKKLLNLRVIGADTLRPATFGKMFWVRGLLAGIVANVAILVTVGIILFMPFWDKRRQNLWDKVSNTYVVNDVNDAWGRGAGVS